MRPLLPALLALLAACSPDQENVEDRTRAPAPAAPATAPTPVAMPPAASAMRSFGAWEAACDNTRRCTLFGFPAGEDTVGAGTEGWGFVRIERGAEPAAEPVVTLAGGVWMIDGQAAALPMEASVDGGRVFRLEARGEGGPYYAGELRGAEARAFIGALQKGRVATLAVRGHEPGLVPLGGAKAALLWVDERQGRTPGGTPGAARPPVVVAVRPTGGTVATPPALLRRAEVAACLADQPEPSNAEVTGTRLTPDRVLWEVPCGAGAYNQTTAFYFGDAAGGGLQPVVLTTYEGEGDTPAHHAVNAGFDAATGRIEAFMKARGVGDCGSEQAWVWDGRAFVLVHDRTMGRCAGVVVDDWPVLHRAEVR